jgi:cystathionine beta-lyase/cystathionine gamma-synthase
MSGTAITEALAGQQAVVKVLYLQTAASLPGSPRFESFGGKELNFMGGGMSVVLTEQCPVSWVRLTECGQWHSFSFHK